MKPKYKITFSSIVKPVVSEEKDKYLAKASVEELRTFLPKFDKSDLDLLPFAASIFVAAHENLNGAIVSGEDAIKFSNKFVYRPTNAEHNRETTCGVILNVGFAEFGTEVHLEVKDINTKSPFNVVAGGYVWKIVNEKLAELLEDSNDPSSEFYQKISCSFEVGYDSFDIVLMPNNSRNLEDGTIISDETEKAKYVESLKTFGGNGRWDENTRVAMLMKGDLYPLGIGFTTNPAAAVVGVAVPESEVTMDNETEEESAGTIYDNTIFTDPNLDNLNLINDDKTMKKEAEIEKNVAEAAITEKNGVKPSKEIMKITSLKDITEEAIASKVITASSIEEYISAELAKLSEDWSREKKEKEAAITSATETCTNLKNELATLKASLEKLESEKAAREKQESFNCRMAALDEKFELNDEDRKVIASQIKDLSDEAFKSYESGMDTLLKAKNKAVLTAATATTMKAITASATSTETVKETVEKIVEVAKETATATIPATSPANQPSYAEKWKSVFSKDSITVQI